jgi:hypothetical protein
MTQRQLASTLFAVVGFFLAAYRLPDLLLQGAMLAQWQPVSPDPAAAVPQRFVLTLAVAASALSVVLGLALVGLRNRIANRLFSETSLPTAGVQVQAVAFSVLGCYFVIQGLHNTLWFGPVRWAGLVQAVLGLALFFMSNMLAALWTRWHTGDASDLSVRTPSN